MSCYTAKHVSCYTVRQTLEKTLFQLIYFIIFWLSSDIEAFWDLFLKLEFQPSVILVIVFFFNEQCCNEFSFRKCRPLTSGCENYGLFKRREEEHCCNEFSFRKCRPLTSGRDNYGLFKRREEQQC